METLAFISSMTYHKYLKPYHKTNENEIFTAITHINIDYKKKKKFYPTIQKQFPFLRSISVYDTHTHTHTRRKRKALEN